MKIFAPIFMTLLLLPTAYATDLTPQDFAGKYELIQQIDGYCPKVMTVGNLSGETDNVDNIYISTTSGNMRSIEWHFINIDNII